MQLEKNYPGYASKYNLVTFCEHVPYSVAKEKGNRQDKWLLEYCNRGNTANITAEELERVYRALMEV
jgi:hypothetical protein